MFFEWRSQEKECATDEYWHNRQSVLVMIIVANASSDTPLFADEPFVLVVHAKGIVSILACSFGDRCVDNIEASFFFIEWWLCIDVVCRERQQEWNDDNTCYAQFGFSHSLFYQPERSLAGLCSVAPLFYHCCLYGFSALVFVFIRNVCCFQV